MLCFYFYDVVKRDLEDFRLTLCTTMSWKGFGRFQAYSVHHNVLKGIWRVSGLLCRPQCLERDLEGFRLTLCTTITWKEFGGCRAYSVHMCTTMSWKGFGGFQAYSVDHNVLKGIWRVSGLLCRPQCLERDLEGFRLTLCIRISFLAREWMDGMSDTPVCFAISFHQTKWQ